MPEDLTPFALSVLQVMACRAGTDPKIDKFLFKLSSSQVVFCLPEQVNLPRVTLALGRV